MGGASRVWFHHSLEQLHESLDKKLQIYIGDPIDILEELIKTSNIKTITWNRCYEPWRIARDKKLNKLLENLNVIVKTFNGSLLWGTF